MAHAAKFYAVAIGHGGPQVYTSWYVSSGTRAGRALADGKLPCFRSKRPEAEAATKGFKNSKHKSFKIREAAVQWLNEQGKFCLDALYARKGLVF